MSPRPPPPPDPDRPPDQAARATPRFDIPPGLAVRNGGIGLGCETRIGRRFAIGGAQVPAGACHGPLRVAVRRRVAPEMVAARDTAAECGAVDFPAPFQASARSFSSALPHVLPRTGRALQGRVPRRRLFAHLRSKPLARQTASRMRAFFRASSSPMQPSCTRRISSFLAALLMVVMPKIVRCPSFDARASASRPPFVLGVL